MKVTSEADLAYVRAEDLARLDLSCLVEYARSSNSKRALGVILKKLQADSRCGYPCTISRVLECAGLPQYVTNDQNGMTIYYCAVELECTFMCDFVNDALKSVSTVRLDQFFETIKPHLEVWGSS